MASVWQTVDGCSEHAVSEFIEDGVRWWQSFHSYDEPVSVDAQPHTSALPTS